MKFYNRTSELDELRRIQKLSFEDHSRLTVITGRRRIGKTSLVMNAIDGTPWVYLFVGRKSEASICAEFTANISKSLDCYVPVEIKSFRSLFHFLMEKAENRPFNLIIDEFQEFYNINASIYSDLQNIWDQYRHKTKMNLIVCGSVYSGRADNIIKLSAFDLTTLKDIMKDFHPQYTNDDLLALYAFTGGVPKYVELFCENVTLSVDEMIHFMVRQNSSFTEEGKHLLIEEFGKILQLISLF